MKNQRAAYILACVEYSMRWFKMGLLGYSYDWISVPLVYTQLVTIAVYFYFAAGLLGQTRTFPFERAPAHVKFT